MIRFATWSAVSTIEQTEGASLDHQIAKCRERGIAEGWKDTGLTFVADGYSRTGYINLDDAERDIPPLADCLSAMRAGAYDVLCLYNFDRLGDLIIMVANDFRNHKRQLYSVSQPSKIFEDFDPYSDDSSYILQVLAPIWQKQRLNDLRRKWRAGMPRRLENGLTPLSIPFGYRWVSKKDAPEPVPIELDLVRQMGEWFMQGHPLTEVKRRADATTVLSPRGKPWDVTTIRNILANPHYAGQVALYKTSVVFSPEHKNRKKQVAQPHSHWMVRPGKHFAIWTVDEHRAILRELDRRRELHLHSRFRYPLSGLLYCSVCGRKVYRHSHLNSSVGERTKILTCNRSGPSHIIWEYDDALPMIAAEIQATCSRLPYEVPDTSSHALDLGTILEDLRNRRVRVQQSAELGVFSPSEAATKIASLETQIEQAETRIQAEAEQVESRAEAYAALGSMVQYMKEWVMTYEPATVNKWLSALFLRILVHPDRRVSFEVR